MKHQNLGAALLASLLGCSTLTDEIKLATSDVDTYREGAKTFGLEPDHDVYIQALDRWPWATGAQLHRRAVLLNAGLNSKQLDELDKTRSEEVEFRLLKEVLQAHPATLSQNR